MPKMHEILPESETRRILKRKLVALFVRLKGAGKLQQSRSLRISPSHRLQRI
jgi:hypothetical protein